MKLIRVAGGLVPFLNADGPRGASFANLLYNFEERIEIPVSDLLILLATAAPGDVVLGRRLERHEIKRLLDHRRDSNSEAFAFMLPSDEARWRPRGSTHR